MSCDECGGPATPGDWLSLVHDVLAKTYAPVLSERVEKLDQLEKEHAAIVESLRSATAELNHQKRHAARLEERIGQMSPEGIQKATDEMLKVKTELAAERNAAHAAAIANDKRTKSHLELIERLSQIIADLEAANLRLRKQMAGETP